MKKLVKQSDGSYATEEVSNVLGQVMLVAGAPFTGLAGNPQAGGQARANTIVSLLLGGALGATIAYPIIRKGISVASFGKANEWLSESHATNASTPATGSASL